MIVMGIDPGLSGGLALVSDSGVLAERMPTVHLHGKGSIDLADLGRYINLWEPELVIIEEQQSMPKQGVSSSFRTGMNYGILLGFTTGKGIPLETVSARVWKKALKVPADKDAARAIATRLFPDASHAWSLKCEDGVAEAALLAHYGRQRHAQR